jgi:hypothetical protein
MEEFKFESFKVKSSKSGHFIPVVNGVHLHSAYDPIKEAKSMVEKNYVNFKENKNVLVFGLGFEYHIDEIISFYESEKIKDFKIVVIEPNNRVIDEILKRKGKKKPNIEIHNHSDPSQIFTNDSFTKFLAKKPVIFAHPPSFNLYRSYFETLLKYKAPNDLETFTKSLKDKEIKEYFLQNKEEKDLDSFLNKAQKEKETLNESEFLLMAFFSLIKEIKNRTGEKNV